MSNTTPNKDKQKVIDKVTELNGKPLEGEVINADQPDPIAVMIVAQFPKADTGAPNGVTLDVVSKLLAAFSNDYNVTQACQFAGISRDAYYGWIKASDYFSDKMEEARQQPNRLAREIIAGALMAKDVNTAKWFLERRDPDYKPKAEVDNNLGLDATRKKIGEFLDDGNDYAEQPDAPSSESAAADSPEAGSEVADAPTDIS